MPPVFRVEDFIRHNGFYSKPHCRKVVLNLYEGKCASCPPPPREIEGDSFHVAHIIPRSRPDLMEKYFPGLDVDNLLNLKLSCKRCNFRESNFVLDALPLQAALNYSVRLIYSRLESVLIKLKSLVPRIEINGTDTKICTDVLYIDADEISSFASKWHGAVVIPKADLDARVREALNRVFGGEVEDMDMAVYHAVEEAMAHFRDHLKIDGLSGSMRSSGNCAWLVEAYECLRPSHSVQSSAAAVRAAGLIDGIYLDADELDAIGGLVIPLRTETQRWFYEIFATIVRTHHKLETSNNKRYVVLDEHEWLSVCECSEKLRVIESGIGKVSRRLKTLEIVAHFRMCDGELHFGDEDLQVPEDVRRMCRAVATDSIWGDGALVRKSRLRPWLVRAFSITEQAAQRVTGPHLIRIGDELTQFRWMPPLPNLTGKTRGEIQLESPLPSMRRRRRRSTQQSA